jgi:integrase
LRRYFRKKGLHDIPLPTQCNLTSVEFQEAYQAALAMARREIGAQRSRAGSVGAAIATYYDSQDFLKLAGSTRGMRRRILELVRSGIGGEPLHTVTKAHIVSVYLNRLKPFERDNWLKALRGLFKFAVGALLVKADPTAGIQKTARSLAGSIHTWTEPEIAQYRARHGLGTVARLALELLLNLGQRRSDVCRLGPQHVRDGFIYVVQKKTKMEKVDRVLRIPILPDLKAALDATPTGQLVFLVRRDGVPFTEKGFGTRFGEWCEQAGLPAECSAHGLRKACLVRLIEAGATEQEAMAISGHRNSTELRPYIEKVRQAQLAAAAMDKLAKKQQTETLVPLAGNGALKDRSA